MPADYRDEQAKSPSGPRETQPSQEAVCSQCQPLYDRGIDNSDLVAANNIASNVDVSTGADVDSL